MQMENGALDSQQSSESQVGGHHMRNRWLEPGTAPASFSGTRRFQMFKSMCSHFPHGGDALQAAGAGREACSFL